MQTISWLDAWTVWFSGREVPGDTYMGRFTILTWGRIGKIVTLVSAFTIILDIVAKERLQRWGARSTKLAERIHATVSDVIPFHHLRWVLFMLMAIGALTYALAFLVSGTSMDPAGVEYVRDSVLWVIVGAMAMLVFGVLYATLAALLLGRSLSADKPGHRLRYVSVGLLLVGFHLDLLAS